MALHEGHYIGRRFDGPTDEFNHFAQNSNFNNSAYRILENRWHDALQSDKKVTVRIKPKFKGNSLRPHEIQVDYTIDGKKFSQKFANRYGSQ